MQNLHAFEKRSKILPISTIFVDEKAEDRHFEQLHVAQELAALERSRTAPHSRQSQYVLHHLAEANIWFHSMENRAYIRDLETKLYIKFKEMQELKQDEERAHRGVQRCEADIAAMLAKHHNCMQQMKSISNRP